MSSIWDFIKRHRGKLLVGGVIAGAAYAIHTAIQNLHEQQQLMQQFKTDPLRIQARRHYVYDTNQRACDKSIIELTQCVAKRILLRFDVESAIAALKGEPQLSNEQRLQIWNKLKVLAVGRIMALAYSFSLLTVALKCQISILASYICESFDRVDDSSWWSKYMGSYFGSGNDSSGFGHTTIDANAQQIFLKCIQYYTTQGVEKLLDRIETVCEEELCDISLKNEFDSDCLKELFETIKRRMQSIDTRHFSYLIVPKFADQDAFALPHSGDLQALLHRLIEMLESTKCKSVASSLIDFYLHAAVHVGLRILFE